MERLRLLRKERNVPQTTLAQYLGITQAAYANYEVGKREPDNETLIKLAQYFNTSVDYLLGNSDIKEKTPSEEGVKKGTVQIAGRDGSFVERELTDDQIDIVKRMIDQMPDCKS